jgi:hypothetical protein
VPDFLSRATALLAPFLAVAMQAGHLADRDPVTVAEWLLRIGTSLVLVEPPGDLRAFLAELLVPALTPEPAQPATKPAKEPVKRAARQVRKSR